MADTGPAAVDFTASAVSLVFSFRLWRSGPPRLEREHSGRREQSSSHQPPGPTPSRAASGNPRTDQGSIHSFGHSVLPHPPTHHLERSYFACNHTELAAKTQRPNPRRPGAHIPVPTQTRSPLWCRSGKRCRAVCTRHGRNTGEAVLSPLETRDRVPEIQHDFCGCCCRRRGGSGEDELGRAHSSPTGMMAAI